MAANIGSGLLSYYKFDTPSGVTFDSFGSENLVNINTVVSGVGKIDEGAVFVNASNQELQASGANVFDFDGTTDFTFTCWAEVNSLSPPGSDQVVLGKYDDDGGSNDRQYLLFFDASTDQWRAIISEDGAANSADVTPTNNILANVFDFLVMEYRASDKRLTLTRNNGTGGNTATAVATNASINQSARVFSLGFSITGADPAFDGTIDEVTVHDRILTSEEKTFLYNNGDGIDLSIFLAGTQLSDIGTSLSAHWALEEISGTRLDSTDNDNDLTDNNTVGAAVAVIASGAHLIRANSEYLALTDSSNLDFGDEDFTIAAWVSIDALAFPAQSIFSKWTNPSDKQYLIDWIAGGTDRFRFLVNSTGSNPDTVIVTANNFGAATANTFVFLVVWHDSVANTINIQVNNGTADSAAFSVGVNQGAGLFTLGSYIDGGATEFFNGILDEVGVWSRVLTSTEKAALYNCGVGVNLEAILFPPPVPPIALSGFIGGYLQGFTQAAQSGFVGGITQGVGTFGPEFVGGYTIGADTGEASGQVGGYMLAGTSFGPESIGGFLFAPRQWPVVNPHVPGTSSGLTSVGNTDNGLCAFWPFNDASGSIREDITKAENEDFGLTPWPWKARFLGDKASLNAGLSGYWPCEESILYPRSDVIRSHHLNEANDMEKRVIGAGGQISGAYCSRLLGTFLNNSAISDSFGSLNVGSGRDFTVTYWFRYDAFEANLFHGHVSKWSDTGDDRGWGVYSSINSSSLFGSRNRPTFVLSTDGLASNGESFDSPNSNQLHVSPSGTAGEAPKIQIDVPYFIAARFNASSGVSDITWASGVEAGGTWESRIYNQSNSRPSLIASGVHDADTPFRIGLIEFGSSRLPRATLGGVSVHHRRLSDDEIQLMWGSGLGQRIPDVRGSALGVYPGTDADPLGPGTNTADPHLGSGSMFSTSSNDLGLTAGNERIHMEHGRGGDKFAFDGSTSFTFAGWVRFDSTAGQFIFSKGTEFNNDRSYRLLRNNSDGEISWYIANTAGTGFTQLKISDNGTFTSVGTWYFAVCGWDKDNGVMFGRLNDQDLVTAVKTDWNVGNGPFTWGMGNGASPLIGNSDAWGLWKRILTNEEMDFLYSAGSGAELSASNINTSFDLSFLGYDQPGNEVGGHLFSKARLDQRNNNFVGGYITAPGGTNEKRIGCFLQSLPLTTPPDSFLGGMGSGLLGFGPDEEANGTPNLGGWIFGRPDSTQFAEQHSRTLVKVRSEDIVDQGLNIDNELVLFQRENANFFGRLGTETTDQSNFHAKLAVQSFKARPTSNVTIEKVTTSGVIEIEVKASGVPGEAGTFFTLGEIDFGEPYRTIQGPSGTTTPGGVSFPSVSGSVSGYNFFQLNPGPVGTSGIWSMKAKHIYEGPGQYIITTKFIDNLGMTHMRGFQCDLLGASGIESLPTIPTAGTDYPLMDISGIPRLGNSPPALLVNFDMRASGMDPNKAFPERDAYVNSMNAINPGTNSLIQWNFGNGTVSTTKRPFAYYHNPGFYVPVLRYQFNHPSGTLISTSGEDRYGPKSIWLSESLLIGFNT